MSKVVWCDCSDQKGSLFFYCNCIIKYYTGHNNYKYPLAEGKCSKSKIHFP